MYQYNGDVHLDQPDDLASLADDLKVLKAFKEEREVEGDNRQEVDHVHRSLKDHTQINNMKDF